MSFPNENISYHETIRKDCDFSNEDYDKHKWSQTILLEIL